MKGFRGWKRNLRYAGLMLAAVLVLLTIGYLTPRQWWMPTQADCAIEMRVTSNGFHTNLIVPVATTLFDWRSYLSLVDIGDGSITGYRYLGFGWGDRDFYMQTPTLADLKVTTVLRAMFWSAGSVLHIQGYRVWPSSSPGFTVKAIRLSSAQYLALMQFLQRSFQQNQQAQPQLLKRGYRPNSSFYQAIGNYSLIRTCNTWTADGLRAAQVNTPLWPGLAPAVTLHLRNGCSKMGQ